jgi:hypothetical protein
VVQVLEHLSITNIWQPTGSHRFLTPILLAWILIIMFNYSKLILFIKQNGRRTERNERRPLKNSLIVTKANFLDCL